MASEAARVTVYTSTSPTNEMNPGRPIAAWPKRPSVGFMGVGINSRRDLHNVGIHVVCGGVARIAHAQDMSPGWGTEKVVTTALWPSVVLVSLASAPGTSVTPSASSRLTCSFTFVTDEG